MIKIIAYFSGFFLLLGLAGFMTIRFILLAGGPPEQGRFQLSGLQQEVQLERGENGRVQISASRTNDAFRTLGFVHARDRLWQLQRFKWAADSEWSSVFGDAFLPADRLTAALLHPLQTQPETALEQLPAGQRRVLEHYAAGINIYIDEIGTQYPLQFTLSDTRPAKWQAADVLRVFMLQQWLFQTGWQQDLAHAAVLSQLPDELLPFLFEAAELTRLRELAFPNAISDKTSVFELLEADHQLRINLNAPQQLPAIRSLISEQGFHLTALQSGPQAFGFWYDVSLEASSPGESWRISGFSLPGAPLFWAATNEEGPSWTAQHAFESRDILVMADTLDSPARRMAHSLKRTDGSEIPFRFLSTDRGGQTGGGFLLNESPAANLFRRPAAAPDFRFFFNSMMQRARLQPPPADAEIERTDLSDFRPGAFPAFQNPFETSLLEISTVEEPSEDSDTPLLNTIDRAFFERQINNDRLELAAELARLIQPYVSEPQLQLSYDYLANWDGRYDRYAVAATIVEGSLRESTRRALKPYVDKEDFQHLERLGLISLNPGRELVRSHINAAGSGRASAVDDAFFARRVLDAIEQLQQDLGTEPYTWRWANRYRFQYGDDRLCGASFSSHESAITAIPDSLQALEYGWFTGRQSGCRQIVLENPYPVSGHQQLINAALGYHDSGKFRLATITTGFLQQFNAPGSGNAPSVRLLQLPGYAVHPFSPYYGSNVAPDLRELQIETRRPAGSAASAVNLLLYP